MANDFFGLFRTVRAVRLPRLSLRRPRFNASWWQILGAAILALLVAPYAVTILYLIFDPPLSALMAREKIAGHRVRHEWRDFDAISPNLAVQVIASEDARFCTHWGVDWDALSAAMRAADNGRARGASTITMQTAKNLFLWNKPAMLRKPLELPLALWMDAVLGKRRIMELYLNIAEWGPGIFGAEAAARYHFGKSAAELTRQEAAQLAAALPAPTKRNAGMPGPATSSLARRLRRRAVGGQEAASCVLN